MQRNLFDDHEKQYIPNLLPIDGVVEVYPDFFSAAESDSLFNALLHTIKWQQNTMRFYGKEVKLPRLSAWYGDPMKDYAYSGIKLLTEAWTEELLVIRQRIEAQSATTFTSVLLNRYRDGNDSVSWHRDNEKVLRVNPVIASVSFGAARVFRFRHIHDHRLIRSVLLTPGMFILMKNETQHFWEHTLPKTGKVGGERISLTFRVLY